MSDQTNLRQILTSTTVGELPLKSCLCVEAAETVAQAVRQMREHRRGSALVCTGNQVVGIFTERDFLRMMHEGIPLSTPLREVMTPHPQTIQADALLLQAWTLMDTGRYRRLPVLDDQGQPLGLMEVKGIVSYLVEHFPEAVYNQAAHQQLIARHPEGA